MALKKDILEAIGNTPLVRLNKVNRGAPGELYAKCEFMNPGGSIKDRIGWYMIEKAEKEGKIKPGGTIVESTSGYTGMGLAITSAVRGYKTVFVLPDKMSEEKVRNLRAFGARVVITPTAVAPDDPRSYYKVGRKIAEETPNAIYMNQYNNPDNAETHYKTTGPEIWEQTQGKIATFIAGIGTCGTICGVGKFLKEKNPKIKIVGVDPKGSILKDLFETGKKVPDHQYKIEGIGEDFKPDNCNFDYIDEIVRVEDKESYLMARALLTKEGLFTGSSSGAAVVGAMRYMAKAGSPGLSVVILPDSGNRYLSKLYDDAWMMENSFFEADTYESISDLIKVLHKSAKVMRAQATDSVESVVDRMRHENVSQFPVFKGDELKGIINEKELLHPLFTGQIKATSPIEPLVSDKFAIVHPSDKIEWLREVLGQGKVALVADGGQINYILTNIDLITFLSWQSRGVKA
jgi:cystathionine beta-synthase